MIKKIIGLFISSFFGIGFVVLALITLLPADASKTNLLGYYGVCSFVPISTTILFVLPAILLLISFKNFRSLRHML